MSVVETILGFWKLLDKKWCSLTNHSLNRPGAKCKGHNSWFLVNTRSIKVLFSLNMLNINICIRHRKAVRRLEENLPGGGRVVPRPDGGNYSRISRQPPSRVAPDLVFFCRRVYDFRQKRILKNPCWVFMLWLVFHNFLIMVSLCCDNVACFDLNFDVNISYCWLWIYVKYGLQSSHVSEDETLAYHKTLH